jgi:hypothetical protein
MVRTRLLLAVMLMEAEALHFLHFHYDRSMHVYVANDLLLEEFSSALLS